MGSIFKKMKSILKNGTDPVEEGMSNYSKNILEVEKKAISRLNKCSGCKKNVKEPIKMFRVNDERIKGASDRMCDGCGCALPYLLRQDLKVCKYWEE